MNSFMEASSEISSIFGGGDFGNGFAGDSSAGNQPSMDMYGHSSASVSAPVPVRSSQLPLPFSCFLAGVKQKCIVDIGCTAGQGPPWRRAAGPTGHREQDLERWAISCAQAGGHAVPRRTTLFVRHLRILGSRWN